MDRVPTGFAPGWAEPSPQQQMSPRVRAHCAKTSKCELQPGPSFHYLTTDAKAPASSGFVDFALPQNSALTTRSGAPALPLLRAVRQPAPWPSRPGSPVPPPVPELKALVPTRVRRSRFVVRWSPPAPIRPESSDPTTRLSSASLLPERRPCPSC